MELAQITAGQVVMLFLLMGTGIAAVKTGVLKPEGKQTLSNLLVYLVVPAMIVNSYRMEFSMEILHNLLAAFGMSLLALLIGTGITLALTARRKDSRTPIFRFACIFSNAAYMGFPLISALFGSEGLLYASAYVTVFNILLWTMGYGFVSGSSDPKEVLHSLLHTPVLYAMVIGLCIYLLQIPVPQLIAQPLELMANMTTPLSMVITGMLLAAGDLGCIVRSKPVWKLAAVRMLLILAPVLVRLGHVLRPIIEAMDRFANWFVRLSGYEPRSEISASYTVEEVASIVVASQAEGVLTDELGLLSGTLEFSEETAGTAMVPLDKLVVLPEGATPADVEEQVAHTGYSRFPISGDDGSIVGYVHLKDVLYATGEEREQPITPWRIRRLEAVSADDQVEDALRHMQRTGVHCALVREAGAVVGILFLEDILELLVGEVRDVLQRP